MQIVLVDSMPLIIIRLFPPAAKKQGLQGFLAGLLGPTQVKPGCLGCSVASESDPDALLYIENWQSDEDLLNRLQSDDFGKVLMAMEVSTRVPEVSICQQITQQGLEFIYNARLAPHEGAEMNDGLSQP